MFHSLIYTVNLLSFSLLIYYHYTWIFYYSITILFSSAAPLGRPHWSMLQSDQVVPRWRTSGFQGIRPEKRPRRAVHGWRLVLAARPPPVSGSGLVICWWWWWMHVWLGTGAGSTGRGTPCPWGWRWSLGSGLPFLTRQFCTAEFFHQGSPGRPGEFHYRGLAEGWGCVGALMAYQASHSGGVVGIHWAARC